MNSSNVRLGDLGERRLIAEHLAPRYAGATENFGDDCAHVIDTASGIVVATTDPAPQPVAWQLGFDDYYHWGWLLAAINLSDIAAAGGRPLGLLSSLTLPMDLQLHDFYRLLQGIDDCCALVGTQVIGGNLKEAADGVARCEATAFGLMSSGRPLSRRGAAPGDVIVALGPTGSFWAGVLSELRRAWVDDHDRQKLVDVIVRPVPQVQAGLLLRERHLLKSCTDASDGLYASIHALTVEQGLGALLEIDAWQYPETVQRAAAELRVDPTRLAFGFGDLQLVGTANREDVDAIRDVVENEQVHFMTLGHVVHGADIRVEVAGKIGTLNNFDNERFTRESQFTAGLDAYAERLLERPLIASTG